MSEWVLAEDDEELLPKKPGKKSPQSDWVLVEDEQKPGMLERAGADVEKFINRPIESLGRSARDILGGGIQGLANVIPGLYNLGASGANLLGANAPKAPMLNVVPESPSQKLGEIGSFFAGPGILGAAGRVPRVASALSSLGDIGAVSKAQQLAQQNPLIASMAGNALLGGAYSPDNQLQGMALGAAAPALIRGAQAGYNALRPSSFINSPLSAEELLRNLEITAGTETGIGDVVGSPMLKRMQENVLSKIPMSGTNEAMQRSAGAVIKKGENILERLRGGGEVENVDRQLSDALNSAFEEHRAQKNAVYGLANKYAKQSNLELKLPTFSESAKKNIAAIEDTNILKFEPEMQSLLRRLTGYKSPVTSETTTGAIVDEFGKPLLQETKAKYPSLQEANLLKGKLNDLANRYGASASADDRNTARVIGGLARDLKKDINEAIEQSGNKGLKEAYQNAEENYAKNFSPFLDRDVYKFIGGNADPETIMQSFIKTGKSSDRAELINKLTERLPKENRNLLGYRYLQSAMDENNVLNPMKLKTLLSRNALGPKQLEALFPDAEIRNALKDYVKLVDMNTKGLKLMQNPETGQMAMDVLPLISSSPLSLMGKIAGAPLARRALTSEESRRKIVERVIERKKAKGVR